MSTPSENGMGVTRAVVNVGTWGRHRFINVASLGQGSRLLRGVEVQTSIG